MRVRGGFDSHAFPPLLALAAAWVLALPPCAGAGATGAGSAQAAGPHAAMDSLRTGAAGADDAGATGIATTADSIRAEALKRAAAVRRAAGKSAVPESAAVEAGSARIAGRRPAARKKPLEVGRFDQPRWVMLRSLLLPGWGQLHNGSPIKALGMAAGEIAFAQGLMADERALRRLTRQANAAQEADDRDGYNAAVNEYNARLDEETRRRWLLGGLLVYALLDAYVDAHFRNFDIEFQADPALPEGAGAPVGGKLSLRWTF